MHSESDPQGSHWVTPACSVEIPVVSESRYMATKARERRDSSFSWRNIHDLSMPQPWFCSSPLVIIHVGSDPSWDQTGQLLLRYFWPRNRNRAQNRRKRRKKFRIRLRTITFGSAVAMLHTHSVWELRPDGTTSNAHGAASRLRVRAFAWLANLSLALEPATELATGLTGQIITSFIYSLGRPRACWQECPIHDLAPADGQDMPTLISCM